MEPAETEMTPATFLALPDFLQREMLYYLDLNSILNVCAVSRKLRELCDSEFFWERKTRLDFPDVLDLEFKPTWKEEYRFLWIDTATKERRIAEILDLPSDERYNLLLELEYFDLEGLCDFAKGKIPECSDREFRRHWLLNEIAKERTKYEAWIETELSKAE